MRRKNVTTESLMGSMSDAMLKLLENNSYEGISVTEIARKAGFNRSSYYRHFGSKEEVVLYGLSGIIREYAAVYEKSGEEGLTPYLTAMFTTFRKHKKELVSIYEAGLSYLFIDVLKADLADEEKTGRDDLKQEAAIGAIASLLTAWLAHDMKESPAEVAAIAESLIPKNVLSI